LTCKSLRKLSQSLRDMGHEIGRTLKRFPTDLNRRDSQEVIDERVFVH
jgi:hypothetical protein